MSARAWRRRRASQTVRILLRRSIRPQGGQVVGSRFPYSFRWPVRSPW